MGQHRGRTARRRSLEGSVYSIRGLTRDDALDRAPAALSFLYRLIRRVVELVRMYRMDEAAKDAEILVLRTSWPCCAGRSAVPVSRGRIGRSSPR